MPTPEYNQDHTFSGAVHGSPDREEEHSELKALVDAIAAQLSDATRRHSETLGEMQDRIADMGREAEALRDHIPEQFAPTFEHIEAGVAELAKRLARANEPDAANADANAWDSDNAEALTHVYEADRRKSVEAASTASVAPASIHPAMIDQAWFEARFAEIARDIAQSLAEIRPERGFHQIGERLDQFEQRFGGMLESVATRADLDSVRLIEEHVSEVVNHLVQTQDQLARLNAIEDQLAAITQTLSGGHDAALFGAQYTPPDGGLDVEAIARAAAEQTAMRFADMAPVPHDAAGDLRPLIERMMEENRNGGENTSALLDTMQQAMIRLLDRIDDIELAQRKDAPQPVASFEDFTTAPPPLPEDPFQTGESDSDPLDFSDDVVSPIHSEPMRSQRGQTATAFARDGQIEPGAHKNEKLRQDFIAEARRAKMRLASAGDDDIVVTSKVLPDSFAMSSPDVARGPQSSRPIRPAPARSKASGPSGPSPRLIVLAVAAILALGGLWYTIGSDHPTAAVNASSSQSPDAANDGGKSGPGGLAPGQNGKDLQQPAAGGRSDQQGQLAPSTTGAINTEVSMLGVAVDMEKPATAASMEQAKRHQAMAALSGKLGDAASQGNNASLVPASMVPSEAETEGKRTSANDATAPGDAVGAMRFELPPATVGPLSLRLAAANGDASAEFEVGARLAEGKGTSQDFKEAAKWYRRAADQGLAQAQYRLGTFYERGLAMKADRVQAEAWYKRAANKGNVKAMHNLAVLSANQTDQSPDYATAAQWFEQAAKRGLADSQFNLAILYENGLGVTKDMKKAYMWLSLAAQDKDADAVRRKGIMRGKLTAKDLSDAEGMISEWRAVPIDRSVNDARLAGEEWKRTPAKTVAG